MSHPPNLLDGVTAPLRGAAHLLSRRDLWPYAVRAFLVNLGLLVFLVIAMIIFVPGIVGAVIPEAPRLFQWLITCAIWFAVGVMALMLFTTVGNIVAAPFMEAMTERMMTDAGRRPPAARPFPISVKDSLGRQAALFFLFLGTQIVLWVLLLTPLGIVYPLLAAACAAFFLAFAYLDYPLDARRLDFKSRLKWLAGHPAPVLGFGAVLLVIVPFTAYAFLPAVVCGAVLLEDDVEKAI